MPVRKRRTMAGSGACTKKAIAVLNAAPNSALSATSRRAGIRSARLSTALSSAPTTKPSCTLIVSHDCPAPPSRHSSVSCGMTAEAENQSDMASISASANSQRLRHFRVMGPNV